MMRVRPQLAAKAAGSPLAALRDDRGGMGIFMLLWLVGTFGLGGFAVDTSKAWRMKTMLQATADAASNAGLLALTAGDDASATARRYVELNLPAERMGEVLRASDVEVGIQNPLTGEFTSTSAVTPGGQVTVGDVAVSGGAVLNAVRVTLYRAERNANAEPVTLLRVLGLPDWNLSVRSVSARFQTVGINPDEPDSCLTQGVVARGTVTYTSNNVFDHICVHGEEGVGMGNNNEYTEGTVISMPEIWRMLNLGKRINPKKQTGLFNPGVLVQQSLDPVAVDSIEALVLDYAQGATIMTIGDFGSHPLASGDHIHVHCTSAGTLNLPGGRWDDLILTTNCDISFAQGSQFVNSVLGTTGDSGQSGGALNGLAESVLGLDSAWLPAKLRDMFAMSAHALGAGNTVVSGASSVVFGEIDDCAAGGGSLLLAQGAVKFAAKSGIFGSTIIASGDIQLAANTLAVEGPSILSGGSVQLPANQTFRGCAGADFRIGLKNIYRYVN
jgi:Flp pilus assembly protein TadG